MNIDLFVAQLNQMLQKQAMAKCEDVCDLLCVHTHSAVTATNSSGQPIVEILQPNEKKTAMWSTAWKYLLWQGIPS